jgi:hypothetical protein
VPGNAIRGLVQRGKGPVPPAKHQRRAAAEHPGCSVEGVADGVPSNQVHCQATASASISTTQRGSAKPATNSSVEAGTCSPNIALRDWR